jgi:hypothetical protein
MSKKRSKNHYFRKFFKKSIANRLIFLFKLSLMSIPIQRYKTCIIKKIFSTEKSILAYFETSRQTHAYRFNFNLESLDEKFWTLLDTFRTQLSEKKIFQEYGPRDVVLEHILYTKNDYSH